MRRRRRRRAPISFSQFLWVCVIANVAAGLWWSSATSVRRVKVEGAPEKLRPLIESELAKLRAVPSMRVNPRAIETRIQALPSIRTADLRRSVFGSGTLALVAMKAAGRLAEPPGLYLSDRGEVFRSPEPVEGLPLVSVPATAHAPQLALGGRWNAGAAALICLACADYKLAGARGAAARVVIEAGGGCRVELPGRARVELGSAAGLKGKFAKLQSLLQRNPSLLDQNSAINLVSPSRPTAVPKNRPNNP
ncbi:MAG: hypothetical protein HZC36_12405 [Armatimonadetes bacterium]|nr:hypothetical protein [Armatimonadota bacterium]